MDDTSLRSDCIALGVTGVTIFSCILYSSSSLRTSDEPCLLILANGRTPALNIGKISLFLNALPSRSNREKLPFIPLSMLIMSLPVFDLIFWMSRAGPFKDKFVICASVLL